MLDNERRRAGAGRGCAAQLNGAGARAFGPRVLLVGVGLEVPASGRRAGGAGARFARAGVAAPRGCVWMSVVPLNATPQAGKLKLKILRARARQRECAPLEHAQGLGQHGTGEGGVHARVRLRF